MAPSSDVNDLDEDKDEDESKNYIVHDLFDKPSSENLIMGRANQNATLSMRLRHSPIHQTLLRN